ncbi:MAG: prepilin-type N-terminal cleavage/methylation domain-containing protein [Micavibrio aeruginosavorus]|uniref:Prepilin-type N-terminal cleavage/methylation domain-containing protein n=1 Tax=Micavibrio aeruginosavorus TaxID=349221 RepID=A0A7T5R1A2_9BACT|nr:MAG: prepilin-type N-terminal cleavage/methylation domain-containing protein [Micavibrio aeruginosavorus]
MEKTKLTHDRSQAGFTLVELAIVMIIIGLLIGGILKGQELIANAQITATSSQVKAIEAAMTTFRDSYNAVPGDLSNPTARLPNCAAAPCNQAGDGNNRVDDVSPGVTQVTTNENATFWTHMAAADMIGGVSATSTDVAAWGGQIPSAETGGGFTVGYVAGAASIAAEAGNPVAGHYLALQLEPGTAIAAAAGLALTPAQAARIDRKLDDGVPGTGGTLAAGNSGATNCWTAGPPTVYNEGQVGILCSLYLRIQ